MIRPLRRRHRFLASFAGVAAIAVYAMALQRRLPAALYEGELPAALAAPGAGSEPVTGLVLSDLWTNAPIRTHLTSRANVTAGSTPDWHVELDPREVLAAGDLLLYWTASTPAGDELPQDAYLLGPVSNAPDSTSRFALPLTEAALSGGLVLYSLASQSVFDTADLAGLGGGN